MSFDWFCRSDEEADEETLARERGRPGVARLRRRVTTPEVSAVPPLAGAPGFVPLGPSVALLGRTTRRAAAAGRVRALAVSGDGRRAYAGTAGGLWYTGDAGRSWAQLDAAASSRAIDGNLRDARALPVGALLVTFGVADDGSGDEVLAGTGDPALEGRLGPDGARGVGVRTATGPAAGGAWTLEAKNLAGAVVLALARDLTGVVWAATSDGLYRRPAAARDGWARVLPGLFWDVAATSGEAGEPQRIWAASDGALRFSTDGAAFTAVDLPEDFPEAGTVRPTLGHLRLSPAPDAAAARLWVLGSGARLWRVTAAGAEPVDGVPFDLSGDPRLDRADLALCVSCDPRSPDDVVVAGGSTRIATPDPPAALYRARMQRRGNRWRFAGAREGDLRVPPALAGTGVAGGVHAVAWAGPDGARDLWVGCDGGVFRGRAGGEGQAGGAFAPRNQGLATFEVSQLAHHPRAEGLLLGGARTMGALRAAGLEAWVVDAPCESGGVALDPTDGRRVAVQEGGARWLLTEDGDGFAPVRWFVPPAGATGDVALAYGLANREEDRNSAPESTPAAVASADGRAVRLAVGTVRVWLSEDWGVRWRVLPEVERDPSARAPGASGPDTSIGLVGGEVRVLRWGTPDQLYVLSADAVHLFRRTPGAAAAPDTWARATLYDGPSLLPRKRKSRGDRIPPEMPRTDLAVHDPARGPSGSLYVTTARSGEDDDERHVWWFDGTGRWLDCRLDVRAAAYAVTVDPAHREQVYVGTGVGVYRGTLQPAVNAGDDPTWTWALLSGGLPEAPCLALAVHEGARLLRAALSGRGVFELPLDPAAAAEPAVPVFVRAHALDFRRSVLAAGARGPFPTPRAVRPYLAGDYDVIRLDASPDIRVRRLPGASPPVLPNPYRPPAPGAPRQPRTFEALAVQAALRRAGDAVTAVGGREDLTLGPALDRFTRRARPEAGTGSLPAAGWNDATGRGRLGNVYPLAAAPAYQGAAAAAGTRTTLTVNGAPFAGRDLANLVLRFGRTDASSAANRGAATIITAHTDNQLTFVEVPAEVAAGDAFEIEERTPGPAAVTALWIDEPDPFPAAPDACSARTAVGRALVDVAVHARGRTAGPVSVALLRAALAGAAAPPLPAGWADALRADRARAPPQRGAWLGGTAWSYFDADRPIAALAAPVDAREPGVATFQGTFAEGAWILCAVVLADDDPVVEDTQDALAAARERRAVALRSVRALPEPALKDHAFFEWHERAPISAAHSVPPALPDDARLVQRESAAGPLRPKAQLHLCFMESAVAAFDVQVPAGNWYASWEIVDAAGAIVRTHPTFTPAARAAGGAAAAIATGSHAWRWDGRRDDPPGAGAPVGRLVPEGRYFSRLTIDRPAAPLLRYQYEAEILAQGRPYDVYLEGTPKNDAEIAEMIRDAGQPFGTAGATRGERIPQDCWIQAFRGQIDDGHCVFLGQGTIEATRGQAGPLGGAVATPHDREYKAFVRRDPLGGMANPDRCEIEDLGKAASEIDLRNPAGPPPLNPYANNPAATPGLLLKNGVQSHAGNANWTSDLMSVGCTGVSPLGGGSCADFGSSRGLLRSIDASFGGFGGAGQNAALGGPPFRNKQTKRTAPAPAANVEAWAIEDALVADDHARPELAPPGIPPACAGADEPLHMQSTFQVAGFGGFRRGEIPLTSAVPDEPALDGAAAPKARIRCVLRDYRRGSAYHVYHHGVIVQHEVTPALPAYDLELWVPRLVIRAWNAPAPRDPDRLPENRRNVLVDGNLQVRWFVRYTPAAGPSVESDVFRPVGGGPGTAPLAAGRTTETWAPGAGLPAGLYESVCQYSLRVEPADTAFAVHDWFAELACDDVLSANGAQLAAEVRRADAAAGDVFLEGSSTMTIVRVP